MSEAYGAADKFAAALMQASPDDLSGMISSFTEVPSRQGLDLLLQTLSKVPPLVRVRLVAAASSWLSALRELLLEDDRLALAMAASDLLRPGLLADEDRFMAADAVAELGGTECIELLGDLASDRDPDIRMTAVDGLARVASPLLCRRLPDLLMRETNPLCRANLRAHQLGCPGEREVIIEPGWEWDAKALFVQTAWNQVAISDDTRVALKAQVLDWLTQDPPSALAPGFRRIADPRTA